MTKLEAERHALVNLIIAHAARLALPGAIDEDDEFFKAFFKRKAPFRPRPTTAPQFVPVVERSQKETFLLTPQPA